MRRLTFNEAVVKRSAREAERCLVMPGYPKHLTGVARTAFLAGAAYGRKKTREEFRRFHPGAKLK